MPSDIELYDKAVYKYVKEVIPRLVFSPPDKASYNILKRYPEFNDKNPYPFASVYRDPSFPIDHNRYSSQAIGGHFTKLTKSGTDGNNRTAQYVHSIPVTLTYQVDIWGSNASETLDISQSLLLKLTINNPVLVVPINPDEELGRFHLLDVTPIDNSDLESEDSKGRIYRHTYTFTVNAWIKEVVNKTTKEFKCPELYLDEDIYL